MRKTLIVAALTASLLGGCATDGQAQQAELERAHIELVQAQDEAARAREDAQQSREEAEQARIAAREAHPEIREARRQLKVMRYAVEAWVDADRHDLAAAMERAMHAMELRIAGRRDPEAMEIYEASPGREDKVELLAGASRHLREKGRVERAEATGELAELMMRKRGRGEGGRDDASEDRLRRVANLAEKSMHRAELVEERVRELEERLEGIEELLMELKTR